jgi:hypothetical protein
MAVDGYEFTISDEMGLVWHFAQTVWPRRAARGGGAKLRKHGLSARDYK